jgi:hypothetical protein
MVCQTCILYRSQHGASNTKRLPQYSLGGSQPAAIETLQLPETIWRGSQNGATSSGNNRLKKPLASDLGTTPGHPAR